MSNFVGNLVGNIFSGGATSAAAAGVTVVEGIGNVIDKFVETPDEKRIAEMIKTKIAMQPSLAQIEINKIEAANANLFVSGWRPFIGWVCGSALAYNFIVRELLIWLIKIFAPETELPPTLAMDYLMELVIALLGLAGFRTFEKTTTGTK